MLPLEVAHTAPEDSTLVKSILRGRMEEDLVRARQTPFAGYFTDKELKLLQQRIQDETHPCEGLLDKSAIFFHLMRHSRDEAIQMAAHELKQLEIERHQREEERRVLEEGRRRRKKAMAHLREAMLNGTRTLGFGKFHDLSLEDVRTRVFYYVRWLRQQPNPSPQAQILLDYVKEVEDILASGVTEGDISSLKVDMPRDVEMNLNTSSSTEAFGAAENLPISSGAASSAAAAPALPLPLAPPVASEGQSLPSTPPRKSLPITTPEIKRSFETPTSLSPSSLEMPPSAKRPRILSRAPLAPAVPLPTPPPLPGLTNVEGDKLGNRRPLCKGLFLEPIGDGFLVTGAGTYNAREVLWAKGGTWQPSLKAWQFHARHQDGLLQALRVFAESSG